MEIVRCARSFHALTKSFYRSSGLEGMDHVQMMESHRDGVLITHHRPACGASVENLAIVELLVLRIDAAVVCPAWFYHRTQSAAPREAQWEACLAVTSD